MPENYCAIIALIQILWDIKVLQFENNKKNTVQ